MRLIDADAVLRSLPDDLPYKASVKRVMIQAETVDAVPVVRCRNCKNNYEDLAGRVCVYGPCVDCIVPDNFYCAYGARMDGDSDAETD